MGAGPSISWSRQNTSALGRDSNRSEHMGSRLALAPLFCPDFMMNPYHPLGREVTKVIRPNDVACANAAMQAGGVMIAVEMPSREQWSKEMDVHYPGCGAPLHIAGTNGGKMRCGGYLTWPSGKPQREFCHWCEQDMIAAITIPNL